MSSAVESGRARKSHRLRHILLIAAVLVVGWVGFGLWWTWSLAGLPDVGDPFDVAEFERSRRVAPEDDALPLYLQAGGLFQTSNPSTASPRFETHFRRWADADPTARARLASNRAALDGWFRATEKPRCSDGLPTLSSISQFDEQAALEASRLAAAGDMAGAWAWYRAILRSLDHAAGLLPANDRRNLLKIRASADAAIRHWAADDRVDAPLLRRAVDDLVRVHRDAPPEINLYKFEYEYFLHLTLVGANNPTNYIGPVVPALGLLPSSANRVWFPMRQEPERSRRVLKLIFANWLAWAGRPRAGRPGPIPVEPGDPVLYPVAPDAPAAARAMSPERLVRWHRSSSFARFLYLGHDGENLCEYVIARERAARARLIVTVAEQLYRREHGGQSPPSRQALIGPYMKQLPEGLDGPLPDAEE